MRTEAKDAQSPNAATLSQNACLRPCGGNEHAGNEISKRRVRPTTPMHFQNVRVFNGKGNTLSTLSYVLVCGNMVERISTAPIPSSAAEKRRFPRRTPAAGPKPDSTSTDTKAILVQVMAIAILVKAVGNGRYLALLPRVVMRFWLSLTWTNRDGGLLLLATLFGKFPFLEKLFGDSA
jgi:hypothetical protein